MISANGNPDAAAGVANAPFWVDGCLVLPALNRVRRRDGTVCLEPRVMAVLVRLAERPGEVLSREHLFDTVWSGTVVCEEALTRTISELRRVFRDDARSPRVIETIRKGGYRLVAPVTPAEETDGLRPADGRPRRAWGRPSLAIAGACALAAALALLGVARRPAPPGDRWTVRPLTTFPGAELMPALSPDGTRLAFGRQGEGGDEGDRLDLWVMPVEGGGPPVRITSGPDHEIFPAWSPDGETIAYAAGLGDSFDLRAVPAAGGASRLLLALGRRIAGLDWSPDGTHLAYSAADERGGRLTLRVLDLGTMTSAPLDVPATTGDDVSPVFSPDGRSLAFVREEGWNEQIVLTTALGSGEVREVPGVQNRIAGLTWKSGHELVLSASALVDYGLWVADLEADRCTWMTDPGRPAITPVASRAGDRLVYGELSYDCDIWSVDLAAGREIRPAANPLIASTRADYCAVPSPEGRRIAFLSDRSGSIQLWIADPSGRDPSPLTDSKGDYLMNPRWSPDGGRIAYSAMCDDRLCVFVADAETGAAVRVSGTGRHELLVHWSASGRWLYSRVRRDHAWELWRRHPDGSEAERVSASGYTVLGELPAGDLVCARDGEPGIWRLPPAGGRAEPLVDAATACDWSAVAVARGGAFFLRRGPDESCLGFHEWATEREDSLGTVPLDSGMLAISADGTRLFYDCTTRFAVDLMLATAVP